MDPLDNALHAARRGSNAFNSTLALTAGASPVAVVTSYFGGGDVSASPYEFSIRGDGQPSLVPAPATLVLLGLGLLGLGVRVRRR